MFGFQSCGNFRCINQSKKRIAVSHVCSVCQSPKLMKGRDTCFGCTSERQHCDMEASGEPTLILESGKVGDVTVQVD